MKIYFYKGKQYSDKKPRFWVKKDTLSSGKYFKLVTPWFVVGITWI